MLILLYIMIPPKVCVQNIYFCWDIESYRFMFSHKNDVIQGIHNVKVSQNDPQKG